MFSWKKKKAKAPVTSSSLAKQAAAAERVTSDHGTEQQFDNETHPSSKHDNTTETANFSDLKSEQQTDNETRSTPKHDNAAVVASPVVPETSNSTSVNPLGKGPTSSSNISRETEDAFPAAGGGGPGVAGGERGAGDEEPALSPEVSRETGGASPVPPSNESCQPHVRQGEPTPNRKLTLDEKPVSSSDAPQATGGPFSAAPSNENSQSHARQGEPTSNRKLTLDEKLVSSSNAPQETGGPLPAAPNNENNQPDTGEGEHTTPDEQLSPGGNPVPDKEPAPPPNTASEMEEVVPSEKERKNQRILEEKTAFIEGGKKSIFGGIGKLSWQKRQEKGNSNNSDSIQKRLRRFTGTAKAVPLDIDDLSDDQVIIAVMGPTGAGKSSFIATVTGGDVRIGHELQSCTTEIKIVKYECPDKSDFDVVFVDTPGFDDTERTDVEILKMIADWLNKTYERKIMLTGILYFHRISDNRMAGTPLKNLRMFRELCGKNALQNIILTTTMWDEVEPEVGAGRETELRSKYWKGMIDQGSATARFHSTQESAWDIVDHFVRDATARHAVLLQEEMTEMKKQLPETNAGQKLYTELEVLVHKQQATLKKIRDETKLHADAAILDALKAEYDGLRTQLAAVVNDMETMKLPLGKRILRLIWGPIFGPK